MYDSLLIKFKKLVDDKNLSETVNIDLEYGDVFVLYQAMSCMKSFEDSLNYCLQKQLENLE